MTLQPANDEFMLSHGGNTVRLRPSLRAASTLERLQDGFAKLFRHVDEFHLGTIREIITIAATDRNDAKGFLLAVSTAPLKTFVDRANGPIVELCRAFVPASTPGKATGKSMPWPEVYRELFRTATGWLHWTPETAWNATPTEINEAYSGHIAKLKAIHGTPDKESEIYSPDQLGKVEATGTDPQFDREAFHTLKSKLAGD